MNGSLEFDVIIIGGGPAGLCAAMYAGRGMLRAVLLERGATGGVGGQSLRIRSALIVANGPPTMIGVLGATDLSRPAIFLVAG